MWTGSNQRSGNQQIASDSINPAFNADQLASSTSFLYPTFDGGVTLHYQPMIPTSSAQQSAESNSSLSFPQQYLTAEPLASYMNSGSTLPASLSAVLSQRQQLLIQNAAMQLCDLSLSNNAGPSMSFSTQTDLQRASTLTGFASGSQLMMSSSSNAQLPSSMYTSNQLALSGVHNPYSGEHIFSGSTGLATTMEADEDTQALARALAHAEASLIGSWDDPGSSNAAAATTNSNNNPDSRETTAAALQNMTSSLYVKNLPPDATELFLYQRFAPYGAILSARVHVDFATGRCKGVGFVNFANQQDALKALQGLHGSRTPSGHKLHVTLQVPRSMRGSNSNPGALVSSSGPNGATTSVGGSPSLPVTAPGVTTLNRQSSRS